MPSKHHKRLVEFLLANGYEHRRSGSTGDVYTRPGGTTRLSLIRITAALTDKHATNFIHNVSRELGLETPKDGGKRNAQQIKERRAADRQALQESIDESKAELATLRQQKERADREALAARDRNPIADASLGPVAAYLTPEEVNAITTRIREKEDEILLWQKELAGPGLGNTWRHTA